MVWTRFTNEVRIPKKVLNIKLKGRRPRRKLRSRLEQVRKHVTQREGRAWEEFWGGTAEGLDCYTTRIKWKQDKAQTSLLYRRQDLKRTVPKNFNSTKYNLQYTVMQCSVTGVRRHTGVRHNVLGVKRIFFIRNCIFARYT
jgi:hypothetical protein